MERLLPAEIERRLAARELEDLPRLRRVEQTLRELRGHVFEMPPPGTPVLQPFSGGLDTTAVAALLLEEHGLEIYPVYIARKHSYERPERAAVEFWTRYFQDRYAGRFHDPLFIEAPFPPLEIRWAYEMVENLPIRERSRQIYGDPFYSSLLCLYAAQTARFYEMTRGVRIRTLVTGFMRSDGEVKIDHTLTTLRSTTLTMCLLSQDHDWQMTAIPIEPELGYFYDKAAFIRWATERSIPLERTRSSCQSGELRHCGRCLICDVRRFAFKAAGVPDPTDYAVPAAVGFAYRARRKAKDRLTKVLGTFATVDPWRRRGGG